MKKSNKKLIFVVISVLYFIFIVLCFPTYSQTKFMSLDGNKNDFWINMRERVISHDLLFNLHKALRHKIPEWTMPIAVIVNGINMFFGFKQFKKKWWYYVILLISILMSLMLIDCWWMLYTAE